MTIEEARVICEFLSGWDRAPGVWSGNRNSDELTWSAGNDPNTETYKLYAAAVAVLSGDSEPNG